LPLEVEYGPKFGINIDKFRNDLPPKPPKDDK